MERLSELTRQALGNDPEEIFQSILCSEPEASAKERSFANASSSDGQRIAEVLNELDQLLGKSQDDGLGETPARIVVALRQAADKLVQEWEQNLAELPVRLIEDPEFRLAGAEEAIRSSA